MFQRLKPSDDRKLDMLHKELVPLIPDIVTSLRKLERSSHKQQIRDVITELFLTIPARITFLLPYLRHITQPLITALQSTGDLV